MLAKALKAAGFPISVGGKKGSAREWANFFSRNPGSRNKAIDVLKSVSKDFDMKYGTNLEGSLGKQTKVMCTGSRIPQSSCN